MSEAVRASCALATAVTIWGVTFALTKIALEDFTPAQIAFLRLAAAVPILVMLARREGGIWVPLRLAVPLGLTGMVGFFLFTNYGLERSSVSTGAFVQAITPAVTALLAVTLLGERVGPLLTVGIALAVVGAAILAWGAVRVESALGLLFLFLSAVSWALYTVLGRRSSGGLSPVRATALPTVLAALALAPVAALDPWSGTRASAWVLVAALGVFGSALAYLLWNFGIARVPASYAGVYVNLPTVVALAVAWLALDESINLRQAGGGAIVVAGALLASTRPAAVEAASLAVTRPPRPPTRETRARAGGRRPSA